MEKQGYGGRQRIVVPLLFPVLTGAVLVAAAFVDAATPTTGPGVLLAPGAGWTFAALGLAFGLCAGVVLRFDPRQRFGWLLGGFGLFWGLDGLAQSWVRFGIRSDEVLAGVGTALWFLNFSTWRGTHGIYLEDLYVQPEHRGGGLGKELLRTLAETCVQRGYDRLEWAVLDWNTPSIEFYEAQGAVPLDEWTVFRLTDGALRDFAGRRDAERDGPA
jgi:GNAT superfamily N-acetyltransferase